MAEEQKKYWTDDPDLVEKYVLDQLSDDERKHLDAEIAECEPCKEKLRHELELAAGIRRHGRDQLKSRLRLRLRKEQSQLMYRYQYISLAAAVVVIAIGVGVYRIWFGDIVAPKKFTPEREIVLKQPEGEQQESASGGETAAEVKKDEGKLEKSDGAKKEILKPSEPASKVQMRGKEKIGPSPAQRIAKTETRLDDAKRPSEIAESAEPVLSKKFVPTQSIWLIGKVVMLADKAEQAQLKSAQKMLRAEESESRKPLNETQSSRTLTIKRGTAEEQIVLQQRSFRELPPKRQTQMARKNLVETLVQHSADGLRLTIYSDILSAEEIESATVETAGSDSLIIATSSQRIYYRLPAEFQQQTKMRR